MNYADEKKAMEEFIHTFVTVVKAGRLEEGRRLLEERIAVTKISWQKAELLLRLGILFERLEDFSKAAEVYSEALAAGPGGPECAYFCNNNLGYALNQLGRYVEAEFFCRSAIAIDQSRHNAHKNLGAAFEGRGMIADAVASYAAAVVRGPSDRRAFLLMENLLKGNEEILLKNATLSTLVCRARDAVLGPRDILGLDQSMN